MKRTVPALLVALLMFTGVPLPAMADVGVSVEFSDEEIRIIGAWYENHEPKAGRGGGKSKHKGLPPGIAKQQLPDGLVHALPAPPRGYERIIVDGKVLLVEIATQVIHDILTDIVLR